MRLRWRSSVELCNCDPASKTFPPVQNWEATFNPVGDPRPIRDLNFRKVQKDQPKTCIGSWATRDAYKGCLLLLDPILRPEDLYKNR